jgi:hypothetical protein
MFNEILYSDEKLNKSSKKEFKIVEIFLDSVPLISLITK